MLESRSMNKAAVILLVGDGDPRVTAARLGYRNENQVYHWPDEFTERQKGVILMRLKAANYKIPKGWE
ncbi:MAG: hypothetical protein ACHP6H_07210 [Legionellales bacterium]